MLAACLDATCAMGNGRRKWCARRWRSRSEPGGVVGGATLVGRQGMTRAAPATGNGCRRCGRRCCWSRGELQWQASSGEGGTSLETAAAWAMRKGYRGRCTRSWWCRRLTDVRQQGVGPVGASCVDLGCDGSRCVARRRGRCGPWRTPAIYVLEKFEGHDVLRTPGGVGAVMGMRPRTRVERGPASRGRAGQYRSDHPGRRRGKRQMGCEMDAAGTVQHRRCARGVNEGGARVKERQRLLRVVRRLRGGLVLRVWTWYGVRGDVPRVWMAEDDVSIYAKSEKQESRECKEKRSVRKGSGGETLPYPARRRRNRTARVPSRTRVGMRIRICAEQGRTHRAHWEWGEKKPHPAACKVRALAWGERPLGQRMPVQYRRLNEKGKRNAPWIEPVHESRGIKKICVGEGIVRYCGAWKSTPRESCRAWRQWLQSEACRQNGSRGRRAEGLGRASTKGGAVVGLGLGVESTARLGLRWGEWRGWW
ncbi:hypothetical protein FB451DRAFT_1191313 [Mycena latifolia]|nr:hypothetical protein FB451DRAFT_1191313 [Mycena latifolia]